MGTSKTRGWFAPVLLLAILCVAYTWLQPSAQQWMQPWVQQTQQWAQQQNLHSTVSEIVLFLASLGAAFLFYASVQFIFTLSGLGPNFEMGGWFVRVLCLAASLCMALLLYTWMRPLVEQWAHQQNLHSTVSKIVLLLTSLCAAFLFHASVQFIFTLSGLGPSFEMGGWFVRVLCLAASLCVALLVDTWLQPSVDQWVAQREMPSRIREIVLFLASLCAVFLFYASVQFIFNFNLFRLALDFEMGGWFVRALFLASLCVALLTYTCLQPSADQWAQQAQQRDRYPAVSEIVLFLTSLCVAFLFYASVQFVLNRSGPSFEMGGQFATFLFLVSLCVAVLSYHRVQLWMQQNLIDAYKEANVVLALCSSQTAFAHSVCKESDKMSWQQIHALLLAANIINHSDFETAADLEEEPPPEHERLIGQLCNESGNCTGRRDETRFPNAKTSSTPETALHLVYRLSMAQCLSKSTDDNATRAENIINGMAFALADAVGGPDLNLMREPDSDPSGSRCDKARKWLADIEKGDNDPGMSGWRFSTARCLADSEILTALGVLSKAVISIDNEPGKVGQPIGYNLSGTCHNGNKPESANDRSEALKGFEGFAKVNQYLLGVTHTLPEVRAAQKWANFARGPEHVGILTLGLFTLFILSVRTCVIHFGCKIPSWRRQLADDLTAGGEVADRRVEAVVRGRTLVRWAVATVPAIGFIGTVRGILEALAKAGDVVWAGDRLERADAIGQLAGELGLAFSTTLFALLVGVLLGWLVAVTRAYEGRVLDDLSTPCAQG